MPSNNKLTLLPLVHIDDNANDRFLVEEAIRFTKTPFEFHGVASLEDATEYFGFLPAVNRLCKHGRPALVLLDYDLGPHKATDFLYWLRTLHRNTAIPVVIYSGSAETAHVGTCYANGANYFLRKARSFDRLVNVIRKLHICFCLPNPRFDGLVRLEECEPNPNLMEAAAA